MAWRAIDSTRQRKPSSVAASWKGCSSWKPERPISARPMPRRRSGPGRDSSVIVVRVKAPSATR